RVGEQRFDAGITGGRNFVDSDVTHVKQFRDSTTAVIVRRIGRRVRLDANFLRAKRDCSVTSDGKLRTGRYAHRTKPVDVDGDHAVASLAHGARQQIDVADEVGDETGLRESVDLGRLIELLDTPLVHHGDAVRQR